MLKEGSNSKSEVAKGISDFYRDGSALLREKGKSRAAENRTEEALEFFRKALCLCPHCPELLFDVGEQLIELGRLGEAEAPLRQAWEQDPTLVGAARLLVGVLLGQTGRIRDAERLLRQARALHPDEPGLKVVQGDLFIAKGRYRDACRLYQDVRDDYPEDEEATEGLVMAYQREAWELFESGSTEDAINLMEKAVAFSPGVYGLLNINLGRMLESVGRFHEAEEHYDVALLADGEDGVAHLAMARLLRDTERLEAAVMHYQIALQIDRDVFSVARPELAGVLVTLGRADNAMDLLREELASDPDCPVCLHNMALACMQAGHIEEAQRYLVRARALDGSSLAASYQLALSLMSGNDIDDNWEGDKGEHDEDGAVESESTVDLAKKGG